MFETMPIYESLVLGALFGLVIFAYNQEKRMKVQDRQFNMLLARLNQLTGRAEDDFTSPLDGDEPLGGEY